MSRRLADDVQQQRYLVGPERLAGKELPEPKNHPRRDGGESQHHPQAVAPSHARRRLEQDSLHAAEV